jgi:hypothetical protein
MKVRLMHPDHPFDPEVELPGQAQAVIEDLGVDLLVRAMARDDDYLAQIAMPALFWHLTDPEVISFRQDVLADCVAHPDVFRALYQAATDSPKVERGILLGWHATKPMARLHRSRTVMLGHLDLLRRVRAEADAHASELRSAGMRALFASVQDELSDAYLAEVERYLDLVDFRGGLFETVRLGMANEPTGFVLRVPAKRPGLWDSLTSAFHPHTVTVAERDLAGAEAMAELQELGCVVAADALSQSADHVKAFFVSLRREIGFYVAALNLYESLHGRGLPTCRPVIRPIEGGLRALDLYSPLLALRGEQPVPSDVDATDSNLVVITGANQGGKSTVLRAVGIAQLMTQCGLFAAAEEFSAAPVTSVFTHFRREEDDSMRSGKFDEELARMSRITGGISPGSLLMCNESFASTNERDAASVGGDVLLALRDAGIVVYLVTHQYELAARLRNERADGTFLRAERLDDGTRTHRIVPGEPLRTSFGQDLYDEVMAGTAIVGAAGRRSRPLRRDLGSGAGS